MEEKKYVTIDYLIETYIHCGEDIKSILRKQQAAGNSGGIWRTLFLWGGHESVFCQIVQDCDIGNGYTTLLNLHDKIKQEILEILGLDNEAELQLRYGAAFLNPIRYGDLA